jgi:hypothetical protein
MNVLENDEVKRFRAIGAFVNSAILLSLVAGIVTIGAQAEDRQYVTLNCAYASATGDTMSDAIPEIPDICGTTGTTQASASAASSQPAAAAKYGVPDASTVLDAGTAPEPMPATF